MPVKKISTNSKKTALPKNTVPHMAKQDMNKLAERWIEILLDQIQSSKNYKLRGAIPINNFDN